MFSLFDIPLSVTLIAVTACLLFLNSQRYWLAGLLLTIAVALIESKLELVALIWLGLLFCVLYFYHTFHQAGRKTAWLFLIMCMLLGLMFGLHILPGFNNVQYLESVRLSPESAVFDVWFNYDKALFGLLVLGIVLRQSLNRTLVDWRDMFATALPIVLIGLAATFGIGLMLGYSHFQLNVNSVFWPWVFKNLFFTVVAEEALFRGLIQRQLAKHLNGIVSVVIGALLFGLAHMAGGWQYVLLSSIAGFMYGYAYLKTGRIEAAIFAHLMLNVTHFLFFVYPYAI